MRTRSTAGRSGHAPSILVAVAAAAMLVALPSAQVAVEEQVDLDAIYAIKAEGFERSKVMELMSHLTDVHGPRLTNSPNIRAAAEYALTEMRAWGLSSVALEPWGPFGRGWSNERFSAHLVEPTPYPLIGFPKAWTPGTDGPLRGRAVLIDVGSEEDLGPLRGTLRGAFVLMAPPPDVPAQFEPQAHRYTEGELESIAMEPNPARRGPGRFRNPGAQAFQRTLMQFFVDEGVAAVLEPGRGSGGTIFVGRGGSQAADAPPVAPQVVLAVEHYGRIVRMLDKDIPVTLEMDIGNTFHDENIDSFNVVAEIPGSDKADEIVMLGAHFDSWHSGTGATDNGAGSAVMMEAMRILKATGLPMRRTVRLGLWSGEEQGLLGSRAYVKDHFADRDTMALKPEHARLSGYFNVDNGTGAIRGVYLQGNEAITPIFAAWMAPFENLGMTTLSIRDTGGTDHLAFDAVGLPGFQFIQDPVEYDTRTHHSNMDVYERIQARDMMHNAVIVASFVYHAANRDELLPRKPLPQATASSTTTSQQP